MVHTPLQHTRDPTWTVSTSASSNTSNIFDSAVIQQGIDVRAYSTAIPRSPTRPPMLSPEHAQRDPDPTTTAVRMSARASVSDSGVAPDTTITSAGTEPSCGGAGAGAIRCRPPDREAESTEVSRCVRINRSRGEMDPLEFCDGENFSGARAVRTEDSTSRSATAVRKHCLPLCDRPAGVERSLEADWRSLPRRGRREGKRSR